MLHLGNAVIRRSNSPIVHQLEGGKSRDPCSTTDLNIEEVSLSPSMFLEFSEE